MSDSISNFITILRNASLAKKDSCVGRHSKMHLAIAQILKREGYIRDVQEQLNDSGHKNLLVHLKYIGNQPALLDIQRISKPGCRRYFGANEIPRPLGGLGTTIITTSQGLMTGSEARKSGLGGEAICFVH
jgi:small subunit ribosomal protein S8